MLAFLGLDARSTAYLYIENNTTLQINSYIIENVNIIPMYTDTVLTHKAIYVKNGVITEINDSISIEDVAIIDGQNNYLSPGLMDMHVHLWDKQELGLYLANGVTSVRNLWGYPMHLRVKKAIENKELIGPLFFVSSPKLTGENDLGDDKVQVSSPEKAKELVKRYKERGFDFIKTYAGIPEDIMNAVIEQSIASDISVVAHPSRDIPYLNQFHPQIASIEHAEEIVQQPLHYTLDSLKLEAVVQQFVATKKSFTPTLTGYYKIYEMLDQGDAILDSDLMHYMNPLIQKVDSKVQYNRWASEKERNNAITKTIYKQHQFHLYLLNQMNEAGVNIVAGTDAGIGITAPGYSIHQELTLYQEAGMSNYNVLKTATVNPSKTHKEFEKTGSIETGKWANFILSKENPLKNLNTLSRPEWVMLQGRKMEKDLLKSFTEKAYDRSNTIASGLRYAEYLLVEK
jgi:amidohydrolase family protein